MLNMNDEHKYRWNYRTERMIISFMDGSPLQMILRIPSYILAVTLFIPTLLLDLFEKGLNNISEWAIDCMERGELSEIKLFLLMLLIFSLMVINTIYYGPLLLYKKIKTKKQSKRDDIRTNCNFLYPDGTYTYQTLRPKKTISPKKTINKHKFN